MMNQLKKLKMAQKVVQVGMSSVFDSFTFLSYDQSNKFTVLRQKVAYTGNWPSQHRWPLSGFVEVAYKFSVFLITSNW